MSDEELRSLEREAAQGDPEARLRYADALARVGRRGEAVQALEPLIAGDDALAESARLRIAALYFEAGEDTAALDVLALDRAERPAFHEETRSDYARIAARLEELASIADERTGAVRVFAVRAATAIGRHAAIDDVLRIFRRVPERQAVLSVRQVLAMWIHKRDRAAARRLALYQVDPSVKGVLEAGGEFHI